MISRAACRPAPAGRTRSEGLAGPARFRDVRNFRRYRRARFRGDVPIAFNFPVLDMRQRRRMESKASITCPPMMSISIGKLPLNGTCVSRMPVSCEKYSPPTWLRPPSLATQGQLAGPALCERHQLADVARRERRIASPAERRAAMLVMGARSRTGFEGQLRVRARVDGDGAGRRADSVEPSGADFTPSSVPMIRPRRAGCRRRSPASGCRPSSGARAQAMSSPPPGANGFDDPYRPTG